MDDGDKAHRRGQRGSRNNKKNMRTKIDMTAVNAALENRWHEERTGYVVFLGGL
jgi:hypothetical protein